MVRYSVLAFAAVSAFAGADAFMATPGAVGGRAPLALRSKAPRSWRKAAVSMVGTTDKPAAGLGFDSHKAIDAPPDTLCRDGTANTEMRAKFERMCREAQDKICKAVEEADGEGKFHQDSWIREDGGGGISRVSVYLRVVGNGQDQEGSSRRSAQAARW